ncbi:MAG: NRDE family protein [Proteobacteria bacterium]|nr:NRDE family protein [Pseudomonadota bacterium]
MCTVIFLRRPDHHWPLILAANRDEMEGRPWLSPGRHWPDRPDIVAGMDELAGGSWLGVNDTGVVAGVLNRKDSLGPDPNLRSRGELVLEALDHADAVDAAKALAELSPDAWRSFNLFIADNRDAYWLRSLGPGSDRVDLLEIPDGISMLTAWDLNAPASTRTRHYLPQFQAAATPDPEEADWTAWEELMMSQAFEAGAGPSEAMRVTSDRGFGTLSSSLIALETQSVTNYRKIWRFSDISTTNPTYRTVQF